MLYFFKVALCWLVFFLFYRWYLEKTTFFRLNRAYLLVTLLLGLLLPLLHLSFPSPAAATSPTNWLPEVMVRANQLLNQPLAGPTLTITPNRPTSWSWWIWLYWLGTGVALLRLGWGLALLLGIYWRARKRRQGHYILVLSDEVQVPFSFLHWLFWPAAAPTNEPEHGQMLRHEETHIQQYHSLDVLLSELTKVLCWFNPLAYHYALAIRDVHEYLADAAVLQTANRQQYGHLLIRQALSGPAIALVNHFSTSQLKKRIHMMKRKKTPGHAQWRYGLALPLILVLSAGVGRLSIAAQTSGSSATPTRPVANELVVVGYPKKDSTRTEVFKIVEQMPEFPGGLEGMFRFLGQNIRYPAAARKDNIEGLAVVQFIVGVDGTIRDPHIVQGIGGGINEEALRVVSLMPRWQPGKQHGQAVNVQVNLPIRFKLDNGPSPTAPAVDEAQSAAPVANQEIFKVVEKMPAFSGGNAKLFEFLQQNVTYPQAAQAEGIEGTTVVQYIVETDGRITNAKVVRDIGGGCGEEALRVVQAMPRWEPGYQGGQAVRVQFNLPIRFKLPETKPFLNSASSLQVSDFQAMPNPSTGLFQVRFQAPNQATRIEVYNLAGQQVFEQSLGNFGGQYTGTIDLSKQPNGEYLIRISQGQAQFLQKVMKQ